MAETERKIESEVNAAGAWAGGTPRAASRIRARGTMLWFNGDKDVGVLRTDDGDRIEVAGAAFPPGEKPVGRCAGKPIEFESVDGAVSAVTFVPESPSRRARLRHRR